MRSDIRFRSLAALALTFVAAALLAGQELPAPKFLADDPLIADADASVDAGRVKKDELGGYADFILNMFFTSRVVAQPAMNTNTLDEVTDSSWFTNRIGTRPMSIEDIVRGPDRVESLAPAEWLIVEGKDEGRQPGFRAIDPADPTRQVYQVEFDPRGNPEMATGAEIIGTAIYHALGYNVVDVYLVEIDAAKLKVAPGATITVNGRKKPFRTRDLKAMLRKVARQNNGRYRAAASRFAEGRNVGPFRYAGTRADDPNDVVPHEHRRELRGNRVFCAWLNHDDSRAVNTLDMLVGPAGRQHVKHYMFDFGSLLGSGTDSEDLPWVGREYVFEGRPGFLTFASFGLYRRPFMHVKTPRNLPAAGNFTSDRFEPASWKPHYPNPAFLHMRADDAFWAARKVAALSPDAIAAIVRKARYSDPAVTDYVTGTLVRRRARVLHTWLTAMNPVATPALGADGRLRFANAAMDAAIVEPIVEYEVRWFRYHNVSGRREVVTGWSLAEEPWTDAPLTALQGAEYVGAEIRTMHEDFPAWQAPVHVYFRRARDKWITVGIDRTLPGGDFRAAQR